VALIQHINARTQATQRVSFLLESISGGKIRESDTGKDDVYKNEQFAANGVATRITLLTFSSDQWTMRLNCYLLTGQDRNGIARVYVYCRATTLDEKK
jgi:hypothetical protein